MSWRNNIKNRDNQIYNGNVEIIKDFPSSDNFAKSKYRKSWVTVLFVDVVDYTGYCERNDDENVGRMIRTFQEGVLSIMRHYDLKHIDIQGDGIFGIVHSPKLNDKNDEKILNCALDIKGFLEDQWKLCNYKISIATGDELMIVVGESNERKVVFAGGVVNEAKKLMEECSIENVVIFNDEFVSINDEIIMNNGENIVNKIEASTGIKYSTWTNTSWS